MIVDAFMFFNELDTLEIRLRELNPVVDIFVLLESGEALSGAKKPFIFEENRSRFAPFLDKIRYVKLLGLPPLKIDTEDRRFWLESFQRNSLMNGLVGMGLKLNDTILISDVDEIPSRNSVLEASDKLKESEVMIFKQTYFKNFFDLQLPDELRGRSWLGTIATRYSTFGEILPDDLRLRRAFAGRFFDAQSHPKEGRIFLENGGWHMTYFGGESALQYKIANFAHGANSGHRKADTVPVALITRESLQGLKEYDQDLKGALEHAILRLGRNLPTAVIEDLEKYNHHFAISFAGKPLPWL